MTENLVEGPETSLYSISFCDLASLRVCNFSKLHLSSVNSGSFRLLKSRGTHMATQQFRNTQTPSKVIHLRNLPWDCSEEELIQLCKPFGQVVNTKCNVGANRNQAFVEFVDVNQAINMVSYYASSTEPAQIRGKTVYIQYSNRHEIVNNKSPGDTPGNVLLVTFEGVQPNDVTIEVIHLMVMLLVLMLLLRLFIQVFSAFGFVHKIATFEKAAGFQALIQFTDVDTASSAKEALDGRSIPRYLLPEHVCSCHMKISYSAHTDLNIKFQSHRSRDYTNPYLPVNSTAIEGFVQPVVGPDGKKKEPESNVLLAAIENSPYAITLDVLHTVFSAFGAIQKIAIFEKNGGMQALIQYPDVMTASVAKDSLEGHCIYDGGYCKLHLTYSRHTDLNVKAYSDRSRDYTVLGALQHPTTHPVASASVWQGPQPAASVGRSNGYAGAVATALPAQAPMNPVESNWDSAGQPGRQTFVSVPCSFPGHTISSPPIPSYATARTPAVSTPLVQSSQGHHGFTQPNTLPNALPAATLPSGQPRYYS